MKTSILEQAPATTRIKPKIFRYNTELTWLGKRAGMARSNGKPDLPISTPPEFKGEPGFWTPEDLFVAAVEICTMETFIGLAERAGLAVRSYESRAEGVLEWMDGGYRFKMITLRPRIVIEVASRLAEAESILHQAHGKCLIARSIRADTFIEPDISV